MLKNLSYLSLIIVCALMVDCNPIPQFGYTTHWNPPTTGTESASVDPGTTTCITFDFPGSGGTTTTTTYPSYPTITQT